MLHIKTILVPTDFSESAAQALQVAASLARDHRSKLVLMTSPPPQPLPPISDAYIPEFGDVRLIEESKRQLKSLADSLPEFSVETQLLVGAPGPSIVAAAQQCQADLIVMGTHGRTGISRLIMGSVAEYVHRHAPCPVLTIKPGTADHLGCEEKTSLAMSEAV